MTLCRFVANSTRNFPAHAHGNTFKKARRNFE